MAFFLHSKSLAEVGPFYSSMALIPNLVAATQVVLLEPWWNPAVDDQAIHTGHSAFIPCWDFAPHNKFSGYLILAPQKLPSSFFWRPGLVNYKGQFQEDIFLPGDSVLCHVWKFAALGAFLLPAKCTECLKGSGSAFHLVPDVPTFFGWMPIVPKPHIGTQVD